MRTGNSIINSITSIVSNFISIIITFISQTVFIRILGAEYLGLNGLFTNVLSMLSIFELGIGNAIVFNLYKPIADNDEKKISALMNFYKKAYNIISLLIFIFGILLLPFVKYMINDVSVDTNVYMVYLLFLISSVSSYFITYKRNLIIACQKNYIINIFHTCYLILLNVLQLLVLFLFENYYLYLVIKIICQLLENFTISYYVTKKYSYLNNYQKEYVSKEIERDIFSRVKALIFHKVGGIIVIGTDNIIISKFFGLVSVGMYTNYNTISTAISSLFGQIISTTTASVGNLLVSKDIDNSFIVFKRLRFLNSWVSIFTSICFLTIVQSFITVWVGSKFKLDMFIVIVIIFNYFQKMQRQVYGTFKDSAGIWREDKYVPLIESSLNIIFSIIFLKIFGLAGVFMGTIISGLALWCYSYPKFVYKKLFGRSYIDYAKETIGYILLFLAIATFTYKISLLFIVKNVFLQLIVNTIISFTIPNIILFITFRKTENFKYFIELFYKILKKKSSIKVNEDQKISIIRDAPEQPQQDLKDNFLMNNQITTTTNIDNLINNININNFSSEKTIKNDNYLSEDELINLIRKDKNYIRNIDFNKKYEFDIVELIMRETKIYNFKFDNKYFLRNNKYPVILSNSYKFMRYAIDQDINNLAYIDISNIDNKSLEKIINYTFRKVYYMQKEGYNITFDIDRIFSNSDIINNEYFKECLKYIIK